MLNPASHPQQRCFREAHPSLTCMAQSHTLLPDPPTCITLLASSARSKRCHQRVLLDASSGVQLLSSTQRRPQLASSPARRPGSRTAALEASGQVRLLALALQLCSGRCSGSSVTGRLLPRRAVYTGKQPTSSAAVEQHQKQLNCQCVSSGINTSAAAAAAAQRHCQAAAAAAAQRTLLLPLLLRLLTSTLALLMHAQPAACCPELHCKRLSSPSTGCAQAAAWRVAHACHQLVAPAGEGGRCSS